MQLTGKQIVIYNIIQGIGEPEIQIQQQGVDLKFTGGSHVLDTYLIKNEINF